jgi:type II secretory pathway pseudopilin PulG
VGGCLFAALLLAPALVSAQTPDLAAIQQQIDQLRQQLQALQEQLARLTAQQPPGPPAAPSQPPAAGGGGQTATVPPGAEGAGGPSGTLPLYGAGAASSKVFNPDMAVIGDFLGAAGRNTVNPSPALEMHESEASFQAIVDPYARADFFVSFSEEGVELEEGFVTFPTLPGGLLAKAGKVRAAFGKVNTLHNHVLPWTDRPLVIGNLVNGEEGIGDAGLSVARLIPNPWFFLEGTAQVFRGDSGDLFRSSKRGDLSYVGHLRGYQDITENTNVDLGVSYARGHNPLGVVDDVGVGRFTTQLAGIDATLRWRPLQRSIYHSFVGRSEVIWSRQEQPGGEQRSAGFYVSGDYQLARRWFAGARYDRSDRAASALRDSGQSLLLTYWPSEFSQIRGQYRRTRYADADIANELLFQFQFSIGAHGAHPF